MQYNTCVIPSLIIIEQEQRSKSVYTHVRVSWDHMQVRNRYVCVCFYLNKSAVFLSFWSDMYGLPMHIVIDDGLHGGDLVSRKLCIANRTGLVCDVSCESVLALRSFLTSWGGGLILCTAAAICRALYKTELQVAQLCCSCGFFFFAVVAILVGVTRFLFFFFLSCLVSLRFVYSPH